MKNKEIEELLNELKRRKERYIYCKNNDISFSDEDYNSYLLLSYIEQLENNRDKVINFLKHIRETFSKNDEMHELLSIAINLLKGDSDE